MKRFTVILLVLSLFMALFSVTANAYSPYHSYEYNEFDEAIEAPVGYTVSKVINSASLGLDVQIDTPQDIVVKDNVIYLLDSANSRIILLDENYKLIDIFQNFTISDALAKEKGVAVVDGYVSFAGAEGIAIGNDGGIYIADTLNNRVLCADKNLEIKNVILRPDDSLNDTDASFSPKSVEIDDKNWIYVASKTISLGVMVFNEKGEFQQFFGANTILSATEAIVEFFRELFLSVTQLELVEQKTPVTISKMDFDKDGFLYTVSPYDDWRVKATVSGLIKKLNFDGKDILDTEIVFGDVELGEEKTWFCDVEVDSEGFVNMMDNARGRIFQYTDDGTLLSVFGTLGDQVGCFSYATAVESINGAVLAVDNIKNCIFVFTPTEYGKSVRNAVKLLNDNDLEGSKAVWQELLKQNSNSQLCYKGLGRIADYSGDYKTAMKYYKLAYAQEDYALAFKQQRQLFIEKNINWLVLVFVIIIAGVAVLAGYLKRFSAAADGAYSKMEQKYTIEFYALLHPLDAFSQFKRRNVASIRVSAVIIAVWFFAKIFEYNCTGFAFDINRETDFSLFTTLLVTVGLFVIFVASNWALCTLIEGKGTLKDIVATTAYSLIPFITSQIIAVVLTNVLVPSESVFIEIVIVAGILWSAFVLILGMISIHEFSVSKTVVSLLFTLLGMVIVLFLGVLIFSLMRQIVNFVISVYKEVIFRM